MIKRIITFLFLLIALTALTLLLTLIPEILGSEITSEKGKDFLLVILGENYAWWLLLILVLAIAVLFFFTPEQLKALFKREEKPIALSPEETQKNYDTIRQYLRSRYTRRLDQKMAGRQPVNLRIVPSKGSDSKAANPTNVTYKGEEIPKGLGQKFNEANGRLHLTGEEGAGKTTLMLQLATELLDSEPENLTVLLNLATWSSNYGSLDNWLKEILPYELGVNNHYAGEILQQNRLIMLLDGFDEVKKEHRDAFQKASDEYFGERGKRYVISSRNKDLELWRLMRIEVCPLAPKQLESQLQGANPTEFPEALELLDAFRSNTLLRQVAENPFYFNTLQLLYKGKKQTDIIFSSTNLKELQTEITKRFVEQALAEPSKHGSPKQVRRWLAFLAWRVTPPQSDKVVFELVDLQYDWWKWGWQQKLISNISYFFNHFVQISIILGLISLIATQIMPKGIIEESFFSYRMLIFAIGFAVASTFPVFLHITIGTAFLISLYRWIFNLPKWSMSIDDLFSLLLGFAGLIIGFLVNDFYIADNYLFDYFSKRKNDKLSREEYMLLKKDLRKISHPSIRIEAKIIATIERRYWFKLFSTNNIKGFLIAFLIIFLLLFFLNGIDVNTVFISIYGSLFTYGLFRLAYFIREGTFSILQITTPYQRFTASAKALHFSILQHCLLRWQLYRAGVLPLRLVHFLNEMTTRHLLETDGATWRFRHRILQEYFAGQWRE